MRLNTGVALFAVWVESNRSYHRGLSSPVAKWNFQIEVIQYVTASASTTADLGVATDQTDVEERYAKLIISEACCC